MEDTKQRTHISRTKAVFFDLMGTCLDWHLAVVNSLPQRLSVQTRSDLAVAWREAFFTDIHARFERKLPAEDIDVTHARLLDVLVEERAIGLSGDEKRIAVDAWHCMSAWPDVSGALERLRDNSIEVFVLANGTTRLQLDLIKSSGLRFDMLFSSQLLGLTKPDRDIYIKAMRLIGVRPEESVMLAAHAYDLRAAKTVGMNTVYIQRLREDTSELMDEVKQEVDAFIDGTQNEGLMDLVHLLCQ